MSRLFIFASILVAFLATSVFGNSLDNYIESRQKLIDEENDKFLGTEWILALLFDFQIDFSNHQKSNSLFLITLKSFDRNTDFSFQIDLETLG